MAAVPDLVGVNAVEDAIQDLDVERPLVWRGGEDQVIELDNRGTGFDRVGELRVEDLRKIAQECFAIVIMLVHDRHRRQRLLASLEETTDALLNKRLEVLAWMVAQGTLDIQVVLPTGPDGKPLPGDQADAYFHSKTGVFTDAEGDQVAFSGSVNESKTAWVHNYEDITVFRSWDATRPYLAEVIRRFERLWKHHEPDWIAVAIPEAVRDKLISYRPNVPPKVDPLETVTKVVEPQPQPSRPKTPL